jgi:hypothetical protein
VFVPPLLTDIPDLKRRITEAVTSITREVLVKVSKNWSVRSTSAVGLTPSVVCKKLGEVLY